MVNFVDFAKKKILTNFKDFEKGKIRLSNYKKISRRIFYIYISKEKKKTGQFYIDFTNRKKQ